jgi:hypothetical protein
MKRIRGQKSHATVPLRLEDKEKKKWKKWIERRNKERKKSMRRGGDRNKKDELCGCEKKIDKKRKNKESRWNMTDRKEKEE